MPYVEGRVIHDADSHLMELNDCLDPYLTQAMLARLRETPVFRERLSKRHDNKAEARATHADPAFRAGVDANVMLRKNHDAHGSFIPEDRPHALDLMGFASQLVFTTFCLGNFGLDQGDDMELCYAAASAHNRMMTEFCHVDRRLLATAYIPLENIALARDCAEEAIRVGAKALMVPSTCPRNHAHSHVELDPLWAMAQEAGLPVLFHVGGEDKLNPVYKENGLPPVKDFHGGDDNFTSVSYMPIPNAAMQTIATLIFDGVFDRFPNLKWGAIELGGAWVPGWMRAMDSAAHAFLKNEDRLQKLSARPSEIIRRQFRVAPYPHEDVGWIVANAGEDVVMFSSDYPHVEGGRNPCKRFNDSLKDASAREVERFYCDNYIDMMGAGLAGDLRRPAHLTAA
ncbi:MAG: amidohydrolase family protein [Rhodospirillaceae bacterium]|nr:amidohydrolase family protein [Rhodospirillaceae bacterium]